VVTTREAVRWRGLAGNLGVACPAGTPRGSDGGCAEHGGAVGFSPKMTGGGGAEKTVRHGDVLRRLRSFGGHGGVDEVL
jgi:hypothetical protein